MNAGCSSLFYITVALSALGFEMWMKLMNSKKNKHLHMTKWFSSEITVKEKCRQKTISPLQSVAAPIHNAALSEIASCITSVLLLFDMISFNYVDYIPF